MTFSIAIYVRAVQPLREFKSAVLEVKMHLKISQDGIFLTGELIIPSIAQNYWWIFRPIWFVLR